MNGYLLDTHAFLWWIDADDRVGAAASTAIAETQRVVVSDVSLWECSVKAGIGKFDATPDLLTWFERHVAEQRFATLGIERRHLASVATLPMHHRDPFDRLLIAQAQVEGLALLTDDRSIAGYDVETVW